MSQIAIPLRSMEEPHRSMIELVRVVQRFGVESCLWTAATLAALPVIATNLLELPLDLRASLVIFLSGMLIYNLDHLADSYGEAGTATMWTQGIGRRVLAVLVVGSALGLTLVLALAPLNVFLVFISYAFVGSLYGLPVLPRLREGKISWMRLKDIPGAKAAVVASSITLAAVGLPLAYAGMVHSFAMLPAIGFIWVFVVSNAIMCDVGDLRADLVSRVPTIPVLLGVRGTRCLLVLVNSFVLGMFFLGARSGIIPLHLEAVFSVLLVLAYVLLLSERTPKSLMSFCLDGCSFAPLILAYFFNGFSGFSG